MKKNLGEWMLEGNGDAVMRLDALRARVLSPRPSAAEVLRAVFRPAGAWVALALAWLALAITAHVVNRGANGAHALVPRLTDADLTILLSNESPAPLDHHS